MIKIVKLMRCSLVRIDCAQFNARYKNTQLHNFPPEIQSFSNSIILKQYFFGEYKCILAIMVRVTAMRYDGTSHLYAPAEFPAVAHYEVIQACIKAGEQLNFTCHVGTTRSADTFYACHPRPGSSFNDFWQSKWEGHFMDLKRLNVVAAEMEASTIFVLAKIFGLRSGGISVVLDNVLEVTGETGHFDPAKNIDHSASHIERLSLMGSEIVRILYEQDQAAQ